MRERWWGTLGGLAVGAFDFGLFAVLDLQVSLQGADVRWMVLAFYAVTFGAFGWVIGRLVEARAEIRRQYVELEATKQAAIQNEKLAALGRLSASVAHEVRNPLGVIRASAALVQEGLPEGEDHRALGFVIEETDRLDQMITALLAFSRPPQIARQRVKVEALVDRALALAGDRLAGLEVVREAIGLEVSVDPDLVVRCLLDLVVNASEALGGAGRLALRSRAQEGAVAIEIADSGPGLSAEDRDKVFEPFFTTKITGTGLGLPMAKKIAEAHGGALEALAGAGAGASGQGACFRLRLPEGAR